MQVTPHDGAPGARVTDIDLGALDEATFAALYQHFLEHGVLVFPAQHLSAEDQAAFAAWFGETERLNPKQTSPNVAISNVTGKGDTAAPGSYQYALLKGNEGWHTDSTYMPLASKVAMLSAIEIPPRDGETEFADMRAAYDALSDEMKAKLAPLSAYHSLYYSQERAGYQMETDNFYGLHDKGAPLRPVIKTHPETGRKSIYTGRHAYGIPGMDADECRAMLDSLMAEACQPPRVYTHQWTVGDTVVWDNRCMMHRARPYDPAHRRVLRGCRISGDEASELAPTFADERAAAFRPSSSNASPLSV